jgi:hypothetical protein
MCVREVARIWNLVMSLMLSGARIIIIERFTKSVISGCWVDGWTGVRGCHSASGNRTVSAGCSSVECRRANRPFFTGIRILSDCSNYRPTDWLTDQPMTRRLPSLCPQPTHICGLLSFSPEDTGGMFYSNVGNHLQTNVGNCYMFFRHILISLDSVSRV